MKLLSTLKNQEANNCFILTYNLDLAFFEYMLFAPLYINGCRNVVVVCDPSQYKKSLEDISILRFAGQRYILVPAQTSLNGVFHPKLIFITGDKGGSVTVTSGNLTRAGYTHNLEVATHVQYTSQNPDPNHLATCNWAYETFGQIIASSTANSIVSDRLDQLYSTTPWLRDSNPGADPDRHWLLHNLDESLFKQVVRIIQDKDGSKTQEISILSPFFDPALRSAGAFIEEFDPNKLKIYSKKPVGLNPTALEKLSKKSETSVEYHELKEDPRALHAKVVKITTARGTWVHSF